MSISAVGVRAAPGADALQTAPAAGAGVRSLYLHVPFCERKCEYCDFASVAGLRGHERYVEALRAEVRRIGAALPGCAIDTVFVGGGTPGLLPPALLAAVLDEVRSSFDLSAGAEVTVEANPSSTTEERATAWLEAGVTRVSLGVQSLEDDVLRFLGRVHDAGRALAAVAAVRSAGFVSVNCDLIYAVPGLDDRRWLRTLDRILELDCGHLSCYELTVEEGTPLHTAVAAGRTRVVDAETALRQHWTAVDRAAQAGYAQYEVSNLARPGRECRHNLAYWANAFYAAAGTGAHGHLPPAAAAALGIREAADPGCVAVRYRHPRDPQAYADGVEAGGLGIDGAEAVDAAAAEAERLMVGVRRAGGVEVRHAAGREQASLMAAAGLVTWDGTTVTATRRGQEVLNRVALRLVEGL